MNSGNHLLLLLIISVCWTVVTAGESAGEFENGFHLIDQVIWNSDHPLLERQFSNFKSRFGKSYATREEHDVRFRVFLLNLRRAKRHQKLDPGAVHGITKFSDLTVAEFRRNFLGLSNLNLPIDAHKAPILSTTEIPSAFDWRDYGAVTPVKDQGPCGSSWSFTVVGAVEGAHFLATGKLETLSEQQVVDCEDECDRKEDGDCNSGCSGGSMNKAFQYIIDAGGVEREKDYPYVGTDRGPCRFDHSKIVASVVTNFTAISTDKDQISANLLKHGPLAVGINGIFLQTYIGGVSCPFTCSKSRINHWLLLIGYGYGSYNHTSIPLKKKQFWTLKNSWGLNWGEAELYRICKVNSICGLHSIIY